jgi:hypothetical protein
MGKHLKQEILDFTLLYRFKITLYYNRLSTFSDEFLLLNENQTIFRKKCSTLDNTFVIHGNFELLKLRKMKVFNISGVDIMN